MNILGISCYYHDSAACLLQDGKLIAAVEEERFTREKHDNSFPENAIDYCLEEANLTSDDIDYVVFYEKPITKFVRLLQTFVDTFPKGFKFFRDVIPDWVNRKLLVRSEIKDYLGYEGEILFSKHHLSHAAAAFHPSPFDEAAILTIDGVGEWTTTGILEGNGSKIEPLERIKFPHSIGLLYSTVTSFLGFIVNNDEYKVMGLAAYGEPTYYNDLVGEVINIKEDGSYELNLDYFSFRSSKQMWSDEFEDLFGEPREYEGKITERDKNLAASLQKVTEEIVLGLAERAYEITDKDKLCMSGGVALNSACNGMLRKKSPFDETWIQPAASDAGDALGAAHYLYNDVLENERKYSMEHVFYGPEYNNDDIERVLNEKGATYEKISKEKMIEKASNLLKDGNVISWFQGRMEWGPRALGNRSILADPRREEMMDIVNQKVKHREEFRPFAPSVIADRADEYFDIDYDSPFMLFVFDVHPEKRDKIPAVTHVNNTSRIQTIRRENNPMYYDLISRFGEKTGIPVLLNTSFNVKGEPIVRSPENAYDCFTDTGINYMFIGNYFVKD